MWPLICQQKDATNYDNDSWKEDNANFADDMIWGIVQIPLKPRLGAIPLKIISSTMLLQEFNIGDSGMG